MKQFRHILTLLIAGFVGFSCSDEQLPSHSASSWQGNELIQLTLTAADEIRSGETKAVDVTVDEGTEDYYHISDFVLFQFDEHGNRLVDPQYYTYDGNAQTIPVVLPTGEQQYTIVALANTHDPLAPYYFADATTLDALMGKYKSVQKLEDTYQQQGSSYDLLMNGWTTIQAGTSSLDLTLYRNVAKLTLTINNSADSGITIKTAQVKSVPTKIDYFYQLIANQKPGSLAAPYPNPNTFRNFDYEVDQFNVAEGSTHTLTYYLPCHVMGTSTSSSETTKGNYAPDYATFVELYAEKKDGSMFARYRFYLGKNMTKDYNILPNYHYDLPLTFNGLGNPQNDARVEFMDAVRTEPEANSYILNPLPTDLQTLYNIPVFNRINTFWQKEKEAGNIPNATGYTIADEDQWVAEIIWQTSNQQLIQFFNTDGSMTNNNGKTPPEYKGQQALRIKPCKGARGNVVIGVYRKDNTNNQALSTREYSWSWHLWVTDYNPNACLNQNWDNRYKYVLPEGGEVHHFVGTAWDANDAKYHNKWMMDRNLGALSSYDDSDSYYLSSFGMYYSFGKKDPITHFPIYAYDSETGSFKTTKFKAETQKKQIEYYVMHPLSVCPTSSPSYLLENKHQNLWDDPEWSKELQGGTTKKSFFDPCPPGWKLPERDVFKSLQYRSILSVGYYIYNDNINNSDNFSYFPPSAELHGATFQRQGSEFIFFSTPASYDYGSVLWLAPNGTYNPSYNGGHEGYRSCAHNVRPIQE